MSTNQSWDVTNPEVNPEFVVVLNLCEKLPGIKATSYCALGKHFL